MGQTSPVDKNPADQQPWLFRCWAGSVRFLESGWYEALGHAQSPVADQTTVVYKGVIQ